MSEAFTLINTHLPTSSVNVASFTGTEVVNDVYAFEVTCRSALSVGALGALEHQVPGTRASLKIATKTDRERWVHGVVTEFAIGRMLPNHDVELSVRIEPRLSLLAHNTGSAIHQNLTVVDVAKALLDSWDIKLEERFEQSYAKRVYLTQYQQTDLAFLQRILATVGVFFYFEHPEPDVDGDPGEERIVLCDTASLCKPIPGEALRFAPAGGALEDVSQLEHVTRFGRAHRLRAQRVLLGDFDHRKPGLAQLAGTDAPQAPKVPCEPAQLRHYHHRTHAEIEGASANADQKAQLATAALEQHRVQALTASGTSHARELVPGAIFALEGHPVDHLNARYAVSRVEHRGDVPSRSGSDNGEPTYENTFECVPEHVPMRPARPAIRRRQVAETATVVGAGDDVHTDDLGRIKVKFHWDLSGREDDSTSCWLRVAQAWAGTHFGAQFIPRVGDEVIVTFLGGDADRPIVTGSVYNGTHPTPFELPNQKDTSGFRTQSMPGGDGFNELSFCDRAGEERIYLRAERDLVEDVEQDHKLNVARDQTLAVAGAQTFTVGSGQVMRIGGEQIVTVQGSQQIAATGNGQLAYGGDADFQIGRQLTTRVDGRERREVRGQSNALFRDDCVTKVLGHHTTIVGEHDARRAFFVHVEGTATSHSSGTMQLSSEKDIELRVGDSVIRLTEEGIELSGPALRINGDAFELRASETMVMEAPDQVTLKSKKVLMESESAFLGLGKVAKLKGELVKLNCEDDPVDELDPPEPPKLTTIVLHDEETGKPIPNQRFVMVMPDGSELTGTLDEEGKAEIEADTSGDIIFPDVHNPRPA